MTGKVSTDGLPYYKFRKGEISWENFQKSFIRIIRMKGIVSPLNPSDLADAFGSVEKLDLRVETILVSATTYTDIRKWGKDSIDFNSKYSDLKKGWMASIWGAYILVTKNIPTGTVVVTPEEKYKACTIFEIGQEESFNLKGLSDLKNQAENLQIQLNNIYSKMEELINNSLSFIQKSKGKK